MQLKCIFGFFLHIWVLKRKQNPQVGNHLQLAGPRARLEFANGMQTRCMSMWDMPQGAMSSTSQWGMNNLDVWIAIEHTRHTKPVGIGILLFHFESPISCAGPHGSACSVQSVHCWRYPKASEALVGSCSHCFFICCRHMAPCSSSCEQHWSTWTLDSWLEIPCSPSELVCFYKGNLI